MTVNYRESYDLFACNGILFNHESPRRGETFVTKKITKAVAAISKGKSETLRLGNMDAKRDWGFAKEYVEGMWAMLQRDSAEDFVLATGKAYTVRQFVEFSFEEIGVRLEWRNRGSEERGYDAANGKLRVEIDPRYYRPAEVDHLLGDPTKARDKLGWIARTGIKELCAKMVRYDLEFDGYGGRE